MPAIRLRELEWGYMRHWRPDADGRESVIRYARAAGLDEALVLSIAWPMIEDAALVFDVEPQPVTAIVPTGIQSLAPLPFPAPEAPKRPCDAWSLVAGAATILALATLAFARDAGPWQSAVRREPAPAPSAVASRETEPIAPSPTVLQEPATSPAMHTRRTEEPGSVSAEAAPVVPVSSTKATGTSGRTRPPARAVNRSAAPPEKRPPAKRQSFFKRELFRIVIK